MSTSIEDLTLRAPEDELPHPPRRDVPLWSENYAFVCFDGAAGVGLFIHIGRAPHNPDLWRGTTVAYLPDGELLVSKTLGLSTSPAIPGTSALTATCEQPLERWRLRHDGPALRTSSAAAANGLIVGGPIESLAYDVTFEHLHPIWDLSDWMRQQQWGHAHVEQAGTFRGTVNANGRTHKLAGTGFRDHTLGPRNFGNLNRTCWAHAEFPSGRVFCALRIWSPDDQVVLNQGFVFDHGHMHEATPGEMPTVVTASGDPHKFAVELDERAVRIEGEVIHSTAFMLDEPNDLLIGSDPSRAATKVIVETPCRFTWDGEAGFGWLERSRRIDQL
jgi:hypothetical protein